MVFKMIFFTIQNNLLFQLNFVFAKYCIDWNSERFRIMAVSLFSFSPGEKIAERNEGWISIFPHWYTSVNEALCPFVS